MYTETPNTLCVASLPIKILQKRKKEVSITYFFFFFFFTGTAFECTQLHLYSYVTHLIGEEKTINTPEWNHQGWLKLPLWQLFPLLLNGLHRKLSYFPTARTSESRAVLGKHTCYHPGGKTAWEISSVENGSSEMSTEKIGDEQLLGKFPGLNVIIHQSSVFLSSLRHHHFLSQLSFSGHPVITKTWHFCFKTQYSLK